MNRHIVASIEAEFRRYRALAEGTFRQLSDEELFRLPPGNGNSIAVIARHIGGNFRSRFTDFLTSDGEKEWRNRESEFTPPGETRAEMLGFWDGGWETLERSLAELTDADLKRDVTVRGVRLSVAEALHRSLAHMSYHVGQIIFHAKVLRGASWEYMSIPPGGSEAYNRNPTMERAGEHLASIEGTEKK
jgi:hypothetical protein